MNFQKLTKFPNETNLTRPLFHLADYYKGSLGDLWVITQYPLPTYRSSIVFSKQSIETFYSNNFTEIVCDDYSSHTFFETPMCDDYSSPVMITHHPLDGGIK